MSDGFRDIRFAHDPLTPSDVRRLAARNLDETRVRATADGACVEDVPAFRAFQGGRLFTNRMCFTTVIADTAGRRRQNETYSELGFVIYGGRGEG